jgi:hypothetical protein
MKLYKFVEKEEKKMFGKLGTSNFHRQRRNDDCLFIIRSISHTTHSSPRSRILRPHDFNHPLCNTHLPLTSPLWAPCTSTRRYTHMYCSQQGVTVRSRQYSFLTFICRNPPHARPKNSHSASRAHKQTSLVLLIKSLIRQQSTGRAQP